MKRILQKTIILAVTFIILFNVGFPVMVQAEADVEQMFEDTGMERTWKDIGGAIIDGIIGTISLATLRAPLAAVLISTHFTISQLCGLGLGGGSGAVVTAQDIVFTGSSRNNQINIIDVNFFDFSTTGAASNNLVKLFREGVAKWYYTIRNLSIVASLAVLIYMGIRMAISSAASDKAKYKQMLIDWLVGFAVLFFLHYFMVIILNLNNQLVELIYQFNNASSNSIFEDYTASLMATMFHYSFVKGWGALIIYLILLGSTIALFIMYMKRLFTVGFLIVISPLITITYAIDKMGDGKSQALDTWLKEFTYNVLIQPFHCIIYTVFVGTAVTTLHDWPSIANLVFSILAILFIFKAEGIVKTIFGFSKASSVGDMMAAGALAASAFGQMKASAKNAKKATGKADSSGKAKNEIKRKEVPSGTKQGANGTSMGSSSTSTSASTPSLTGGNSAGKLSFMDRVKGSTFGRALSDFKDDKINAFNELKADPTGALKDYVKDLPIRSLDRAAKLAPKLVVGAMTAGMTGNGVTGAITGFATPQGRFTRKISSLSQEQLAENDIERKSSRRLAAAYENYRMANGNLSDEELYNKSADLLEADISELTDKNEIALAKELQSMKEKYALTGAKKPENKVMKKIESIQLGEVDNNVVTASLDSVKVASRSIKEQNPGMTDKEIMEKSKDLIRDMSKSSGSYLRSEDYKKLDAETKKLAKEVHKTKSVLGAIGDVSKDVVDKEIMKAIEDGLATPKNTKK